MDPALWELLGTERDVDQDRVIEAVIRFAQPGIEIPGVRIVSRFGTIATCRMPARDVIAIRARNDVISIKAARKFSPGFDSTTTRPLTPSLPRATDVRRPAPYSDCPGVMGGLPRTVDLDRRQRRRPIIRTDCGVARFGPTTPTRARRLADASVDPTEARNAPVLLQPLWSRWRDRTSSPRAAATPVRPRDRPKT